LADARDVRLEVTGTPLAVGGTWEFTSNGTWSDYQQELHQRIGTDYDLVSAKGKSLHFRCSWSGQVEHLYVDRITSEPLRVRCEYLQINSPIGD
jgi:hypothetical protein